MSTVAVNPPKTPVTKGSNGLAVATLPNVCKMPGPPAPFVPTLLPNIGKSDNSPQGYSTTVTIEGQPVAIKGATFNSTGDVASQGTGGGLVSSNVQGPTSFIGPGSMDVKIEGKNVQLLSDPMLNNGGPSGTPANSATMAGLVQAAQFASERLTSCGPGCTISTYDPNKCPKDPKTGTKKTPHHIVPKHCFKEFRNVEGSAVPLKDWKYDPDKAPCICVNGADKASTGPGGGLLQHGRIHARFDLAEAVSGLRDDEANSWTFGEAKAAGVKSTKEVVPGCDEACVAAVVDKAHGSPPQDKPLRAFCPKSAKSDLKAAALDFAKAEM